MASEVGFYTTYTDETVELNGVRHHYLDWRPSGGDATAEDSIAEESTAAPVLMIHGLTQHAHSFDGLAAHLVQVQPGRRCIALDVRGRGLSDWAAPESYVLPTYVADVLALLEHLGIETFHYVGTSMGGLIGMTLAMNHAERFLSLTLNDIGPEIAEAGLARISSNLKNRKGSFESLDDYLERGLFSYFYWMADRPRDAVRRAAEWAVKTNDDGTLSVRYDPVITPGTMDSDMRKEVEAALWQGFDNLTCPVLVVRGADSDLLAPATLQAMKDRRGEDAPPVQSVEVPATNHCPTLDEAGIPEAVADLIHGA